MQKVVYLVQALIKPSVYNAISIKAIISKMIFVSMDTANQANILINLKKSVSHAILTAQNALTRRNEVAFLAEKIDG